MAEYIERENLAKEGWYLQRHVYGNGYAAIETKKITDIPAADVRPVVRGKWTKEHLASTSGGAYPVVRCSVCGASLPFFEGTTYCPNCGADMREES